MNRDVDPALEDSQRFDEISEQQEPEQPGQPLDRRPPEQELELATESRRHPSGLLGQIALGLSLLLLATDVVALVLADNRSWAAAIVLAQVTTVGTIVAFLVGAVAVIMSRGRRWGISAVVLAVVANPIIMTKVLGFLAGS
jgi:zinc transporter ZupT